MIKRAVFLGFLMAFCAFSNAREISRIVSLAPSLTKMIYLLNAGDKVVGCTSFCIAAKQDNKTVVGNAVETNIEKILILNPDIIVVTSLTKPETIELLKKTGMNVKVFSLPSNFSEICSQFVELGEITNKRELAENIIKEQKERLTELIGKIPVNKKPGMFIQIGANPIFAAVPGSFMHDYIVQIKGFNVANDIDIGTLATEGVLIRNPDIIIIVAMGQTGIEEKKKWESYPELKAAKNKKIFIIDPDKSCSPTPVEYVDTIEELIKLTYNI